MPVDANGTYTRVHDWTADEAASVNIEASRMDAEMDDQATVFNTAFYRDGSAVATGDFDMNANSIILDADADTSITADTDDQIDIEVGGADVVAITGNQFQQRNNAATSAEGPNLILWRESASPAASDLIGNVSFDGEDSADNQETYAKILASIIDPTTTSEDGALTIQTVLAGTLANRVHVAGGFYSNGATGGDQGVDTANFSSYYVDGVQLNAAAAASQQLLGVFSGYVDSAGTAEVVPSGWSATRDSLGVYTVTHNLSLATAASDLIITVTPASNPRYFANLGTLTANSFGVNIYNEAAGAQADIAFHFIAIRRVT